MSLVLLVVPPAPVLDGERVGARAACKEPACSQLGFGLEPHWDKGSAPRAPQSRAAGLFPQRVFALQAA